MNSIQYFAIVVFLLLDALMMAYRTAVMSLSEGDLSENDESAALQAQMTQQARSRIQRIRDNPAPATRAVWFWQITAAALVSLLLAECMPHGRWLGPLTGVVCVYLFSAAIPYVAARMHPLETARRLSGAGSLLITLALPFTASLSFLSGIPARILGVDPKSLEDRVSEDEILSMVNEGHEQGTIDEDEAEMITNIFQLDDKHARDIMTHRGDISAIEGDLPLEKALSLILTLPYSRFPVVGEDIDHIMGILYLKDAVSFYMKEQFRELPLSKIPHLLRDVQFIPETVDVDDLFARMQESRTQMAVVVDEYGQTCGLVTMEDILEEIVGNILDEYDKEEKLIAKAEDGRFHINGKALLDDVSKSLDSQFDQEDYDTISGYLTERLGHIPTADDRGKVIDDEDSGYRFRIISTSGTMIGWVEAFRIPQEDGAEEIRSSRST